MSGKSGKRKGNAPSKRDTKGVEPAKVTAALKAAVPAPSKEEVNPTPAGSRMGTPPLTPPHEEYHPPVSVDLHQFAAECAVCLPQGFKDDDFQKRLGVRTIVDRTLVTTHPQANAWRQAAFRAAFIDATATNAGTWRWIKSPVRWFSNHKGLDIFPRDRAMTVGKFVHELSTGLDLEVDKECNRDLMVDRNLIFCEPYHFLTPGMVVELLGDRKAIWIITKFFPGVSGIDQDAEGIYWRGPKGGVCFSPDDSGQAIYGEDPDLDWLFAQNKGFEAYPVSKHGPFFLLRVTPSVEGRERVLPSATISKIQAEAVTSDPRLFDRISSAFGFAAPVAEPTVVYNVHTAIASSLTPIYSAMVPSGMKYDAVVQRISGDLSRDVWAVRTKRDLATQKLYAQVVHDTACYVLYQAARSQTTANISHLRTSYATEEARLVAARAPRASDPVMNPFIIVFVTFLEEVLFQAMWGINPVLGLLLRGAEMCYKAVTGRWWACLYLAVSLVWMWAGPNLGSTRCWMFLRASPYFLINPWAWVEEMQFRLFMWAVPSVVCGELERFWLLLGAVLTHLSFNLVSHQRAMWFGWSEVDEFVQARAENLVGDDTQRFAVPLSPTTVFNTTAPVGFKIPSVWRGSLTVAPSSECTTRSYHIESVEQLKVFLVDLLAMTKSETDGKPALYPLIATTALPHAPHPGIRSLVAAVMRLHTQPTNYHEPGTTGHLEAVNLFVCAANLLAAQIGVPTYEDIMSTEAFCDSRGKKGLLYLNTWLHDNFEGQDEREWHPKIHPKSDETVVTKEIEPGFWSVRPRPIVSFSPALMAELGPVVETVMDSLKAQFDTMVVATRNGPTRFRVGSGRDAKGLSLLGTELAEAGVNTVACAGDDTATSFRGVIVEADASSYDSTLTEPAFAALQAFYQMLGCTVIVKLLQFLMTVQYKARRSGWRFTGTVGYGQNTGSPLTTLSNTILNFLYNLAAIMTYETGDIAQHFQLIGMKLGLEMKVKIHRELWQASFLKGVFIPTPDGRHDWMPMPSLVNKICKVMTPYKTIFPGMSQIAALRATAYAMGSSFGSVPEWYPVLGPYLKQLRWLGVETDVQLPHEGWKKPKVTETTFTRDAALVVICERYCTDVWEIIDCEQLIQAVDTLPALIAHPLLHKMLTVDYG